MLSSRIDQENAVHARQLAGAAKPLNQVHGKTPAKLAPKTPGKVPLNDENEVDRFGGGGKGTSKKGGGKQAGSKLEKNLFQTPAPRDRPALGFKTTNAKATAFQTPAPKKTAGPSPEKTQKRTVGRASRIQIHQEIKQAEAEPEIDWANEEIQYIPPRPTPLPDVPSDDEWDKIDFSILRTGNFEGARQKALVARKAKREEEQNAEWDRKERERFAREDEEFMRTAVDLLNDPEYDDDEEVAPKKVMPLPEPMKRQLGTLKSREAAGALSQPKKTVPSYAAPTAATKAKVPMGSVLGRKKTPSLSASGNNARAASYQTLGYAKGRAVSNTIRPSSSTQNHEQVSQPAKPKRKDPLRELEELIEARDMEEAGILAKDLEDDIDGGVSLLEDDDDEEEEVFQMKMPEA